MVERGARLMVVTRQLEEAVVIVLLMVVESDSHSKCTRTHTVQSGTHAVNSAAPSVDLDDLI